MSEKNGTPVGVAASVTGKATVLHPDGTSETLSRGSFVYQGDVIETDAAGGVNITFNDETVFAVSNNAKMTIDEFVYDPNKDGEGQADVSVVRGVFAYTSGFVGKEDHDDVHIKTPAGSIGIRGTTLTGYIPPEGSGESPTISLIEGAIVVQPNQGPEVFLDESRETVVMNVGGTEARNIGVIPAEQMMETFNVIRTVAPALFVPVEQATGTVPTPAANDSDSGPGAAGKVQATGEGQGTAESGNSSGMEGVQQVTDQGLAPSPDAPPPTPTDDQPVMEDVALLDQPLTLDGGMGDALLAPLEPAPFLTDTGMLIGTMAPPPPPPPLFQPLLPPPGGDPIFFQPVNHSPFAKTTNFTAFEQPGLEGGVQALDSSRFFHDPDGNALSYVITGVNDPNGVLANVFITGQNELAFQVKSAITADADVHIFVAASDGKLTSASIDFAFHVYDAVLPLAPLTLGDDSLTLGSTGGYRFSTKAGNDMVAVGAGSSNNVIFGGLGDDTIHVQNGNNKAFGEVGNDFLKILGSGNGNLISGGAGSDVLHLEGTGLGSQAFGGDGNDRVELGNTSALAQLEGNDLLIDAGSGFDTLLLVPGGNVNFTLVNQNTLHSIERIQSGTGSNGVTLDIRDIFEHTDTGFLFVENLSSLNVTNAHGMAGLTLKATGVANPYVATSGVVYDVYSNGAQTLYIDQSIGSVTGV